MTDSTPTADTRWSMVARAAAGDAAARSVFGHTYLPLVRAFFAARWRGTVLLGELEDAVQETFVECFTPAGPLGRAAPERSGFRSFLFGIVRNVAMRFEERARARAVREPEAASVLATIASQEETASKLFDREWARTEMRAAADLMHARALAGGPEARLRVEILRLRFAEDLPLRSIASRWTIDPDAVHRAYARAREEFHSCLREVLRRGETRTESQLEEECRRLFSLLE